MKAPTPSYDQGHEAHRGFGCLKPGDVFWRQRLQEPGEKLKPGDWSNEPSDFSPVELAEQYIEMDNQDARRRDLELRKRTHSTTRERLSDLPRTPPSSTLRKQSLRRDGSAAARLDVDAHRSKRLRPAPPKSVIPEEEEEEPRLSNRERRRLDRGVEQRARRKTHDQTNRAQHQTRKIRKAPQQVFHAKHIVSDIN